MNNITETFQFPESCLILLKRDLRTFHGLFEHSRCSGKLLEELIYRSLQTYYRDQVKWTTESHSSDADITISQPDGEILISVKSGTVQNRHLVISGYRLQKHDLNFDNINHFLLENNTGMTVAFPAFKDTTSWKYQLIYLPPSTFQYPTTHKAWIPQTGQTSRTHNKIVSYSYIAPNGVQMEIKISLSHQLWWTIPLNICNDPIKLYP
jgi:hypothetical protein